MSSFRVNKEPTERNSRKYGPPLRDSDLQGPSPYSTFISKSPPPDGNNKLLTANGGTLPYIAASVLLPPLGNINDQDTYSINNTSTGKYRLSFVKKIDSATNLPIQLFGSNTTFIPCLLVTSNTSNITASFTYNPNEKHFIINLKNSAGILTNGNFNFIAFASS